jgi:spore germination protein KB
VLTETVSGKKMIILLSTFMLGSTIILGGSTVLGQDSWVSVITGALWAFPLVIIYARIVQLYPNKNIYEICLDLFGNFFDKVIIFLFSWYALHLGALVLRNFSEFIQISSKAETPQIIVLLSMMVVIFYLVKSGIKTMGRWSLIVFWVICLVVIISFIFSYTGADNFDNLLPFLNHTPGEFLIDSFYLFSFPYAEVVLFLTFFNSLQRGESPYKVFLYALFITMIILLVVAIRNITLLGPEMLKNSFFPSYVATRLINVGKFLTKIEGIVMINFILLGITKTAVCLLATCKGITHLFDLKDYKAIAIPISFFMVALAMIVYPNVIEMLEFAERGYYCVYASLFQVIIPLLIWIVAEIKNKKIIELKTTIHKVH